MFVALAALDAEREVINLLAIKEWEEGLAKGRCMGCI